MSPVNSSGSVAPEWLADRLIDPRLLTRADIVDCEGATCPPELDIAFFGIGTAKSRTTWLARCLDAHPQVAVSRPKEIHFFAPYSYPYDDTRNDRFLSKWSWCAERFAHAEPGQVRGEFINTTINHGDVTAPLLKVLFPKARFIVCLRDPVTRTYSHYWNTVRERHVRQVPQSFEAALEHGEILRRSRYAELMRPWFETFPRGRFLIHFDFEMDADPAKVVQDTYRFIDVEEDFTPDILTQRVNAPALRNQRLRRAQKAAERLNAAGLRPLVEFAKRAGAEQVLGTERRRHVSYPPLTQGQAARLYKDLAPSIDELEQMLGRDLSPWRRD